ncbi:MAG: cell wall-binding protein [Parcubacteria group bacterium Gr01-1014_31]|nr:MAG: cell wall-binding protein [Parcubacteria group bacterium Gr01-1014_31]
MVGNGRWREVMAVALLLGSALVVRPLLATDYTSNSFILRDPVIVVEGGRATSTSFEYFSSTSQTDIGESTSTTFIQRAGFLYFPVVTSPVVTATAGNAQVALTWTAASASLGWTVSGYEVGQSTTSGGTYSYTNVGAVTSSTQSGLTNGTAYYFVVRGLDAFSNAIATSTEATGTPAATPTPTPTPTPGGGTGGGASLPRPAAGTISASGTAYPGALVQLLKDGQFTVTTIAATDGTFTLRLANLTPATYRFIISATDSDGRRSDPMTVAATVTANTTTTIVGILLAPTIGTDKVEVRRGEAVVVSGQSAPGANVAILGDGPGDAEFFATQAAGADGRYRYEVDTGQLVLGGYRVRSRATVDGVNSPLNRGERFTVGERTVITPPQRSCDGPADFNHDCRVNIIDFSILVYWFYRPNPLSSVDLSSDGRVDLTDFSILIYHWTG